MIKSYRIEEYTGEIDTERDYVSECLNIDEASAIHIQDDITMQMNSSDKITVAEILANLLEKYYGNELIYAIFYLGYKLGLLYKNGILIPSTTWRKREGEV